MRAEMFRAFLAIHAADSMIVPFCFNPNVWWRNYCVCPDLCLLMSSPHKTVIPYPEQWTRQKKQTVRVRYCGMYTPVIWRIAMENGPFNSRIQWFGYGSIPINTIFRGMNIHLPAILMFTRGTRFWHTAIYISSYKMVIFHNIHNYVTNSQRFPGPPFNSWVSLLGVRSLRSSLAATDHTLSTMICLYDVICFHNLDELLQHGQLFWYLELPKYSMSIYSRYFDNFLTMDILINLVSLLLYPIYKLLERLTKSRHSPKLWSVIPPWFGVAPNGALTINGAPVIIQQNHPAIGDPPF